MLIVTPVIFFWIRQRQLGLHGGTEEQRAESEEPKQTRRWGRVAVVVLVLAVGALVVPAATAASAVQVSAAPTLTSLGTLGGDVSYPVAVNDRGQVVGVSETADGEFHAFFWDDGVMIDLAPEYLASGAMDINNKGQVVFQRAPAGGPVESVLWTPTTTISLGIVDAGFVNEKGQVAGTVLTIDPVTGESSTNPFLWERGVRTDMAPIPGWGTDSRVIDLNDKGVVLGTGLGPESFELGFIWSGGARRDQRGRVGCRYDSHRNGRRDGVPVARRRVHPRGAGRYRKSGGRHQRQGPGHRHVLAARR